MGAVLLALLLLSTLQAAPARADDDDDGAAVPRQIVVKLKPKATIGHINKDKNYRTRTIDKLLGSKKIYLLKVPKGKNPGRVLNLMQNDRRLIYAESNFRTESPEGDPRHYARSGGTPEPSSDPAPYRDQYAIGAMNLAEAHGTSKGRGSVIAVVDTGAQLDHPELADSFTDARYDFINDDRVPTDVGDGKDNDGDGDVDEMVGHGTHVAGISRLAAPEARIMPLRVLDSDGNGNSFVLAEAVTFASKNGADVINLSLGASRESELLMDVIDNAAEGEEGLPGGTVTVAAVGNENTNVRQYPAAGDDDVLAVASVNEQRERSSFSNYGAAWVDVAAPGSDIHGTFPTDRYAQWSGTSMATPFAAGQAALLHGEVPMSGVENDDRGEHRVECVSGVIKTTAQPLSDKTLGAGHADAGASVQYLRANGCPLEADDDSEDDD